MPWMPWIPWTLWIPWILCTSWTPWTHLEVYTVMGSYSTALSALIKHSHFSTLRNNDVVCGLTFSSHPSVLNLPHNIHPIRDPTKNNVLIVQEGSSNLRQILSTNHEYQQGQKWIAYSGNEELAAVGIGSRILEHTC